MQCVVTCTFELKRAGPEAFREVLAGLERLGLRPVPHAAPEDVPPRLVLGAFESPDPQFLRNCLCFKLRDLFDAQGLAWNAFVLASGAQSAWAAMAARPDATLERQRWVMVLSESRLVQDLLRASGAA